MEKKTIFLVAGGTGGHIIPAKRIAENLCNDYNIVFLTDNRFSDEKYPNFKYSKKYIIPSASSSGNIFSKIKMLFTLYRSIRLSKEIIQHELPDIMIAFGGYPTLAPVMAAKKKKIPIILHEQNSVIGRVNKFMLSYSNNLCCYFPNINIPKKYKDKLFFVKSIEDNKFKSEKNYNIKDEIVILITGGSQGASIMSKLVPYAIIQLPEHIRSKIFIYHQCHNKNELERVKTIYKNSNVKFKVELFFHDIEEILFKSHLTISRAGAGTIFDIINYHCPAILIPYPNSKGDHQLKNAEYIQDNGGGIIIQQEDISSRILSNKLLDLLESDDILLDYSNKLKKLNKDHKEFNNNIRSLIESYTNN